MSARLAVVAIGGNSLIRSSDRRRVEDQHEAIRETMGHVAGLIERGWQVLISHGNGPQVGFIMRRSEVARKVTGLHLVPLVNCVADTQGSIGYQIQQALENELADRGFEGPGLAGRCATVITQVVVRADDPGFENPSKPVGEFYEDDEAADIRAEYPDWFLVRDAGRGWRRVVPSPRPVEVVELEIIRALLATGCQVVAVGGGGIPVIRTPEGLAGVDAVIDKDHASALLARQLGAEKLIISTAVEKVALNFGTPDQRPIGRMDLERAGQYLAQGHFAPGSMGPKIRAAMDFIRGGGREAIITSPENLTRAVYNQGGTHITP